MIPRDRYLNRLIDKQHNGRVKIITGIRRCGKSYLLFHLYKNYLLEKGVHPNQMIEIVLDRKEFEPLRNPNLLYQYIKEKVSQNDHQFYIFIDEIQLSYKVKIDTDEANVAPEDHSQLYTTFYDVLNNFLPDPRIDITVTGSNSRMLSSDVATNFRDRGVEIRMHPLSFREFFEYKQKNNLTDIQDAWDEYIIYGGMPLAVLENDNLEKADYLTNLFKKLYFADLVERYQLKDDDILDDLVHVLASSIGSLSNPSKLANTINSTRKSKTTDKTIRRYMNMLEDAFIFSSARRYDVKGKKYFDFPQKYYIEDVGLRNALLNFRQIEETHLMENIIYNDLTIRGYNVDVGAVKINDTMHEIDFVVNRANQKFYIQSAFNLGDSQKLSQETAPLLHCRDSFPKIILTSGHNRPRVDENGIQTIGVTRFLLSEDPFGTL